MSFLDTCIQDSLPIWRSCLETPFLRRMADGTLDEECFKGYIVDDSLYLREYSKVFAWGMIHSNDMEEIRNYYSLLAFVNEAEDSTRRYYLKRYGLLDEEIQRLAWENHGFRTEVSGTDADEDHFGVPHLAAEITQVAAMPSYAAMEKIIAALS